MELTTTTTATGSCSSLSFSMSSSSSSSLDLFKLEDESIMNNSKHGRLDEERFFFVRESDEGEHHHFLESCFLCKKPISRDHEILMYRGYEGFCSEKCRTEQMEMDEALETVERRQRLITKNYAATNNSKEQQQNNSMFRLQKQPTIANLTAWAC